MSLAVVGTPPSLVHLETPWPKQQCQCQQGHSNSQWMQQFRSCSQRTQKDFCAWHHHRFHNTNCCGSLHVSQPSSCVTVTHCHRLMNCSPEAASASAAAYEIYEKNQRSSAMGASSVPHEARSYWRNGHAQVPACGVLACHLQISISVFRSAAGHRYIRIVVSTALSG
mmetsp:Transcript_123403/g.240129  ORF Transcript_123403/g.240129 Transcript_123403/m.240129 type:complete len:168 (+) Transcript_123403:1561-2064(+)